MLLSITDVKCGVWAMAQKVQTVFIDDIDGAEAAGTVRFALDGTDFEIALSTANSDQLRKALETYVSHARRVGGSARRTSRSRGTAQVIDTHKVREWAKENGFDIKERGRVPADIIAKYKAATGA